MTHDETGNSHGECRATLARSTEEHKRRISVVPQLLQLTMTAYHLHQIVNIL